MSSPEDNFNNAAYGGQFNNPACGGQFNEAANRQKIFTQALAALRKGNLLRLKDMIDGGLDVNAADHFGSSLLCHAAGAGEAQAVSLLLSLGADAARQNALGRTALMIAASRGDALLVETILFAKQDLDLCDASGNTALHVAFEHNGGTVDAIFKLLLASGASPVARNKQGDTPLMLAKRTSPALLPLAEELEAAETLRHDDILAAIETSRAGTGRRIAKANSIRF